MAETEQLISRAMITLEWEHGRKDKVAEIELTISETPEVTINGMKALRHRMGWELIRMGMRILTNRGRKHDTE